MERRAQRRVERDELFARRRFGVLIELIDSAGVVGVVDPYVACARGGEVCSEGEPL